MQRPERFCAEASPYRSAIGASCLLSAFLDRPGEVLTKSDLIDAAWQGAIVEETNLSVQIASLRKHLGQTPEGGEWIATVPRVGYRFVGPVDRLPDGPDRNTGPSTNREPQSGPSIAVLPFVNLSDDREQEYFADGMVEEIITALSRLRWLFVIARNSSFTYKGRAVDVKQVGRELGVRYVLEGSVRKDGNKVRIAGQLIDTSTGAHLWADRFDGELTSVFELQDQVTANVAGAIAPKLEEAEIERAKRKPTESLDAYDYFLRGLAAFHQWTRSANSEALELFLKATELDSNFAAAYAMAARCYAHVAGRGLQVEWPGAHIRETDYGLALTRFGESGRVHVRTQPSPLPRDDASVQWSSHDSKQDRWVIEKVFRGRPTPGFFVETGAADGVSASATLALERSFGWTGILVEPNRLFFEQLRKNRGCLVENACIAERSGTVEFIEASWFGRIRDHFLEAHPDEDHLRDPYLTHDVDGSPAKVVRIPALSLDDLLQRHGAPTRIDFMSIDAEFSEWFILKSFPFDRYEVLALCIHSKFRHAGVLIDGKHAEDIRRVLCDLGYFYDREHSRNLEHDFFVHPNVIEHPLPDPAVRAAGIATGTGGRRDEGRLLRRARNGLALLQRGLVKIARSPTKGGQREPRIPDS